MSTFSFVFNTIRNSIIQELAKNSILRRRFHATSVLKNKDFKLDVKLADNSLKSDKFADSIERQPRIPYSHPGKVSWPQLTLNNTSKSGSIIDVVNKSIQEKSQGRLFTVVHVNGKQFKITDGDVIIVQGYWAPDIGDKLRLEKVLLIGCTDFTLVGRPLLPRDLVRVEATVIEKTLSHNILHFKMKPRKRYKRLHLYRTPYTMLRINLIQFDGFVDEKKDIEGLRDSPL